MTWSLGYNICNEITCLMQIVPVECAIWRISVVITAIEWYGAQCTYQNRHIHIANIRTKLYPRAHVMATLEKFQFY